jgi:hypothetical protein
MIIREIIEDIHKDTYIPKSDSDDAYTLRAHTMRSTGVNDALHKHYRGKKVINRNKDNASRQIERMDTILAKFKLSKPGTVYSGIPESIEQAYKKYQADRSKPIRLHLPAYTSTSTSLSVAASFAKVSGTTYSGRHILMIELPIGTPAVSVESVSYHKLEKEVLLPRGMNIEVQPTPSIIKKHDNRVYIWKAKALGTSPIQICKDTQ